MDLVWLVYGISLLSGLQGMFGATAATAVCAIVFLLMYRATECTQASYHSKSDNERRAEMAEWAMKHVKTSIYVLIGCTTALTFLPSEKTAYMMVGAYATQKVAENQNIQVTGGKVLELINQKLDEYIDEGVESVKKKGKK